MKYNLYINTRRGKVSEMIKVGRVDMSEGIVNGLLSNTPKGTFKFGNYYLVSEEEYVHPSLNTTHLSLLEAPSLV